MNNLAPIEHQKVSDQVFATLRDHILSGRFQPGERLPVERELCESLSVNRSSLREALKKLEQARLIETRHGNGSFVLDFRTTAGFDLLRDLVMPDGKLDFIAVRSILEFRSLIGPEIAGLAARRIKKDGLKKLELIVDKIEACADDDFAALQKLDCDFFNTMVQAGENLAFMLIYNSTRDIYFSLMDRFSALFEPAMKNRNWFRKLYDALAARDERLSRKLAGDMVGKENREFMEIAGRQPEKDQAKHEAQRSQRKEKKDFGTDYTDFTVRKPLRGGKD